MKNNKKQMLLHIAGSAFSPSSFVYTAMKSVKPETTESTA